jgi:hypothetical protein
MITDELVRMVGAWFDVLLYHYVEELRRSGKPLL